VNEDNSSVVSEQRLEFCDTVVSHFLLPRYLYPPGGELPLENFPWRTSPGRWRERNRSD